MKKKDDDASARKTAKVATATGKDADAHTQAKPLSSSTFDANDIQAEWVKAFGYDLRGNYALELKQLASKDYARAQAAIARTLSQKEKAGTMMTVEEQKVRRQSARKIAMAMLDKACELSDIVSSSKRTTYCLKCRKALCRRTRHG